MIKKLLAASLLLAMGVAYADSQSTAFTYQGNLTANGGPANANLDMTFTLFDALTDGNQVGVTQSISQFPVVNGRFTVDLDFPGVFKGTQLWLEVTVGGQTLSPRQPVNSVPVAQYALSGNAGAWSSLMILPASPGDPTYGSPNGLNSPSSGTLTGGSIGSFLQVPQNCTEGNFTATAFGAQGTSTVGAYVVSDPAAVVGSGGVPIDSCVLTANNGAIVTCSSSSTSAVPKGNFLGVVLYQFSTPSNFANAQVAFSFTCN